MSPKPSLKAKAKRPRIKTQSAPTQPKATVSSLLQLQSVEDSKPRLSKLSWLDDVLVYRSSIIPIVLGPVVMLTLFAAGVACAALVFGKSVALTNNVVPLLSVVVGLLLVFRNSTAYERYAEGRKDFTQLISNARNLSRLIWVNVMSPPSGPCDREDLTRRKVELIRLIVGFVFATKHHLRSEGGAHHNDMKGLLPRSLYEFAKQGTIDVNDVDGSEEVFNGSACSSPRSYSGKTVVDEESTVGVASSLGKKSSSEWLRKKKPRKWVRRPTTVRINSQEAARAASYGSIGSATPLIKAGVRTDVRRTVEEVDAAVASHTEIAGYGRMVEVGLPLVIAHEISRAIFRFRRQGCLEMIGPAGFGQMQNLVQSMTDQLGSMERMPGPDSIQTPLPYVFCVHLKQCVTLYLLCLPFVLVETMGWKMIPVVMCTAFTLCGVEGIAAQIEQPFGTDPCDLNLDLFCTELLCECEAIVDRLPEGELDEEIVYERTTSQIRKDEEDGE